MNLSLPNAKAERQRTVKERYSVAFSADASSLPCELKVWHKSPEYMCLLVRDDSASALRRLKKGEKVRMNYYAADLEHPSERLDMEVVKVKKNRQERVKGQYLVDLQILKSYH